MDTNFSRRQLIQAGAALGAACLAEFGDAEPWLQTPGMNSEEIAAIDQGIGKRGNYNEGLGTHVVQFPRNDLKVTLKGEAVPVSLGFGGWAAFRKTLDGESLMSISENVLLGEEVNPFIDAALANGFEVGSVHNHFFYEDPRIFFVYLEGTGGPRELAQRYAKAIAVTNIAPIRQPRQGPPAKTARDFFNVGALDRIVGRPGAVNGLALKFTVGRADLRVREMRAEVNSSLGVNTWCSFVGTSEAATVAGDVAMLAHQVDPVLRLLRAGGFEICALHTHMLSEQPRILFAHFLGRGKAEDLAKTFRLVLDLLAAKAGSGTH